MRGGSCSRVPCQTPCAPAPWLRGTEARPSRPSLSTPPAGKRACSSGTFARPPLSQLLYFSRLRVIGQRPRIRLAHSERRAVDDAENEGRDAVVAAPGVADDRANRGHIVVLDAASE